MAEEKYVCPDCGYESSKPGKCPHCQKYMLASCPTCGNPMVGEQISLED